VLFAQDDGPGGPYGGIVDEFNTDGILLKRFAANDPGKGPLESPWGITQAPADFGKFSNDILIGNDEGPGYINAFDPNTGAFLGHLTHPDGTPIAIPGLWYLTFGGGNPQTGLTKQLYFVAGPTLEHNTGQGLFGRIIAAGNGDGPDSSSDSAAVTAALASMTPGTVPTQAPGPNSWNPSQSGGSQVTGVDGQPNSLQPPVSDAANSSSGAQTAWNGTPGVKQILQTGGNETIEDVLDGPAVGLANDPDAAPLN
jgi:hypothetical protein